ncbi:hypothetical protein H4217_001397, partial [Coemansia sp. RSA 1939]
HQLQHITQPEMCTRKDNANKFVLYGSGDPLSEGTARIFVCGECDYRGTDIAEFVEHRETHYAY